METIIDDVLLRDKIDFVKRQTNMNDEEIKIRLIENNYDTMNVIKTYFNILTIKNNPIKSINQEIYRQIRTKMDTIMKEYNS